MDLVVPVLSVREEELVQGPAEDLGEGDVEEEDRGAVTAQDAAVRVLQEDHVGDRVDRGRPFAARLEELLLDPQPLLPSGLFPAFRLELGDVAQGTDRVVRRTVRGWRRLHLQPDEGARRGTAVPDEMTRRQRETVAMRGIGEQVGPPHAGHLVAGEPDQVTGGAVRVTDRQVRANDQQAQGKGLQHVVVEPGLGGGKTPFRHDLPLS
jgi:hypothetical protein